MKIIEKNNKLQEFLIQIKKNGQKIGLIPTMGSIHKGHLSLIKECQKLGLFSVVSIFVNPTQFNEKEDFDNYPRKKEKDIINLKSIDTDLLFFPSVQDLYPHGIKSEKTIIEYRNILCDKFRPGHFDGVTTVVNSLLKLINPEHAFFGEKDFQQLKIIQKIIEHSNSQIIVHPCNSIRMSNGMSFSSRYDNFKLLQKIILDKSAIYIMKCINQLKENIDIKIIENLEKNLKQINIKKIDYLEVRDELSLSLVVKNKKTRLFIAFYIDNIRIIDNFKLY
jgi:pantoate--beta-alanine ligase|tara:strand:- start:4411 stop:5244 length:834 start_codon:yes stop_codon:yes gene_type:complete